MKFVLSDHLGTEASTWLWDLQGENKQNKVKNPAVIVSERLSIQLCLDKNIAFGKIKLLCCVTESKQHVILN